MKLVCETNCRPARPLSWKDGAWPLINSALLLLMPKCALCWASYISLLSFMGLSLKYQPWFLPAMILVFAVTLGRLIYKAIRTKYYVTLAMTVFAGFLIIAQKLWWDHAALGIFAMAMLTGAVFIERIPFRANAAN